jgi:hypothetical protein
VDPQRRTLLVLAGATALTPREARTQTATRIDLEHAAYTVALTGSGPPPIWSLVEDGGHKVLSQTSTDRTDYRFPLAVFEQPATADLDVSVRFKPVSGEVDRAAGIALRLIDKDNYYVARANALEDNVRLYRTVKGQRIQFAGSDTKVPSGIWQELRLMARGSRFEVFLDGRSLFSANDSALAGPGRLALWTKADSVTWFDDLRLAMP